MTGDNKFEIRSEIMYSMATGEPVLGREVDTWASGELWAIAQMPDTSFFFLTIENGAGVGWGWFWMGTVAPMAPQDIHLLLWG